MKINLCKILGHNIRQGKTVLKFEFVPNLEETKWKQIAYSADTLYCTRCNFYPSEPTLLIGTVETNIGYTGHWQIGNIRHYMPGSERLSHGWISDLASKFFPGKK